MEFWLYIQKKVNNTKDIAKKPKEESYQIYMKILEKAFPLASAPLLRPLIMRVLTKIDNIPQEHLQALVKDPSLYKSAPLEVRRHIWLSDSNLFCQEVRDEIKVNGFFFKFLKKFHFKNFI